MVYAIKCNKDCGYAEDKVMHNSLLKEYLSKEKCPKCKSKIEIDMQEQHKDLQLSKTSPSRSAYQDKRMDAARKRRNKSAEFNIDAKKFKKDPYYGLR